ncbi:MAG: ester cyclase [Rhizobium sp.]|nr:ester cyclase [Rhizobium sp.]
MKKTGLADIYRDYIRCLNSRDWPLLVRFVDHKVRHNGRRLGLTGYREMLEQDCEDIPDLEFRIDLLVSEPPMIASRLRFDVTPKAGFLGLAVNGRRISFAENVFYRFHEDKIIDVWSVIDKSAIERQL